MKLFIVANFTSLPNESGNCRFNYLASMASKKGVDVTLVTSDFCHATKKHRYEISKNISYNIKLVKEKGYTKNISIKRFLSHYMWGKSVKKYIKGQNPDIVYCAVPSLTAARILSKYCKKNNIHFVIDIQDLWPEAFRMIFNPPLINKIIYLPFTMMSNKIYRRANAIVSVSKTYANRALNVRKKPAPAHVVYLGTDLSSFDKYKKEYRNIIKPGKNNKRLIIIDDELILNKPEGETWIAYCGTLGSSYDLESTILAIVKTNKHKIRLIVMGDGPLRERYISMARSNEIKATFTGKIPYPEMCAVLSKCEIAINPIRHNSAASIINKHADYTAAGLPIINTQESSEFRSLIEEYKMGINCENGNVDQMARAIIELTNNKNLRRRMGSNSRRCANMVFNREITYRTICKTIMGEEYE